MRKLISVLLNFIILPFIYVFAPLFRRAAITGVGIPRCRKFGFQPILIHYYQPVPEYESVPDEYFVDKQHFPGFSIHKNNVLLMLRNISAFAPECVWPEYVDKEGVYFSQNKSFGFSSAVLLHSLIRFYGTRHMVEIGSGYSTLISIEALKRNHPGSDFRLTCIEPHPPACLSNIGKTHFACIDIVTQKAENVEPAVYLRLRENDILFIDSSHVSKLNSDVNYLYLHILPRLAKGVIIHIHDIYIPYEYPRVHFYGQQKIFWNEQYLLQAFLTNNNEFEIIMPGYFVQADMSEGFRKAFPQYDPLKHRATSSFWLRKTK